MNKNGKIKSYTVNNIALSFLKKGYLHPEIEGFITAIQDKVVRTNNYKKNILNINVQDKCRKCIEIGETIEHITSGCFTLAQSSYLERHNNVAFFVHEKIAKDLKLLDKNTPHYKYEVQTVLENNSYVLSST